MHAEAKKEKVTDLGFVTKKMLVSFRQPMAFMAHGSCFMSSAVICEVTQEADGTHKGVPHELTVVAFPDGRQIDRSYQLTVEYGTVAGILWLD